MLAIALLIVAVLAAPASAAADTVTVTGVPVNAGEGQSFSGTVATFTDSLGDNNQFAYTATVAWGDGTSASAGTVSLVNGTTLTVTGQHTYQEGGGYVVRVNVTHTSTAASGSGQGPATVADAPLSVPAGTPSTFTGAGSAGSVATGLAAFEAAIGGADNGTVPGEQGGGFRHINWDGIALDGSDPGSTVISPGHVAALAEDRAQPWGLELGLNVAVANDGFHAVNSNVGTMQFPPFSSPNIFAPFNSNTLQMQVVAPSAQGARPAPAATRGLGVVFLNVRQQNATTIQYFNGDALLGQVSAPVAGQGQPSFAGMLFPSPVVTRVVITLGTAAIFSFDGTTSTPGPADSPPNNLVAADDVVVAEPSTTAPAVQTTAGVPLSQAVDTFIDTNPSATPRDFSAVIDWGDGTRTAGTVAPGSAGAFAVFGNHAYTRGGTYSVLITVTDYGGAVHHGHLTVQVAPRSSTTSVACTPSPVAVSSPTACEVTVSDVGAGSGIPPTGIVTFSTPTAGAGFGNDGGCVLGPDPAAGSSSCQVTFTPTQIPPRRARIVAVYGGDAAHVGSSGTSAVDVRAPRCKVKALSTRLVRHPTGLAVIVTCDANSNVALTVNALVLRGAHVRAKVLFGSIHALVATGRPTVLVVKASKATLDALRAAVRRHERVALKLALTATAHSVRAITTTTSASISRLRIF